MSKNKKKHAARSPSAPKRSFRSAFAEWMRGETDLTDRIEPDIVQHVRLFDRNKRYDWEQHPIARIQQREIRAYYKLYHVLAVLMCVVIFAVYLLTMLDLPEFGSADSPTVNEVYQRYVEQGTEETGAVNTVAGMILDYRAFDTLGESHVLYAAMTAVMISLAILPARKGRKEETGKTPDLNAEQDDEKIYNMRDDPIISNTCRVLAAPIWVFGIYIILNGHLSPGGGFSGGALIGAGLILYSIAYGHDRLAKVLNLRTFKIIVLCALCFYSVSKCYSFFCGANGYETIFTEGVPGRILSAGLILPLNIAVGIVVACTMYGLYSLFQRGRI